MNFYRKYLKLKNSYQTKEDIVEIDLYKVYDVYDTYISFYELLCIIPINEISSKAHLTKFPFLLSSEETSEAKDLNDLYYPFVKCEPSGSEDNYYSGTHYVKMNMYNNTSLYELPKLTIPNDVIVANETFFRTMMPELGESSIEALIGTSEYKDPLYKIIFSSCKYFRNKELNDEIYKHVNGIKPITKSSDERITILEYLEKLENYDKIKGAIKYVIEKYDKLHMHNIYQIGNELLKKFKYKEFLNYSYDLCKNLWKQNEALKLLQKIYNITGNGTTYTFKFKGVVSSEYFNSMIYFKTGTVLATCNYEAYNKLSAIRYMYNIVVDTIYHYKESIEDFDDVALKIFKRDFLRSADKLSFVKHYIDNHGTKYYTVLRKIDIDSSEEMETYVNKEMEIKTRYFIHKYNRKLNQDDILYNFKAKVEYDLIDFVNNCGIYSPDDTEE